MRGEGFVQLPAGGRDIYHDGESTAIGVMRLLAVDHTASMFKKQKEMKAPGSASFLPSGATDQGMLSPAFRVDLPISINLTYIRLHRHTRRFVSEVILGPVKLTL